MLVDLTLRHWMLLLTTWLLLRISETVRKIVKALEPPVSAAALLGLRSSRKKSAALKGTALSLLRSAAGVGSIHERAHAGSRAGPFRSQ